MRLSIRPFHQLTLISVAVHVGLLLAAWQHQGQVDGYALRSMDCREYFAIARNVAQHGVFSQGESPPLTPDTWRTPGYPLFLAICISVLGDSSVGLVIVQQLLSLLNVLLLFWIARRWMSDRRASLVAILFLFEPFHLLYSLWLMSTTLFVTVLMLTWLVWLRAFERQRWTWFALLGALAGCLALVRPVGILIPVVLFLGLIGSVVRQRRLFLNWPALAGFAVICLLVVGSWMVRNQRVAGHLALSDQGGVVLAYFKATEVVLWREGRAAERYQETSLNPAKADLPHTVWDGIDARLQSRFASLPEDQRMTLCWHNLAQGNKTTLDSFAISKALSEIGWSYLKDSPLSTAACCLVRCASILTFPLNLALKPPTGVPISRLGSAMTGIVYLLLCLGVVVRLGRGGFALEQVYFPLACTVALLVATTPQIDPRFRVPMIPFLLVLALLPGPKTAP